MLPTQHERDGGLSFLGLGILGFGALGLTFRVEGLCLSLNCRWAENVKADAKKNKS